MKTILQADDEINLRTLVSTTLDDPAYRILEAADGVSALELARQEHPDLLVLDWMMPGMNGLELQARFNELGIRLPVIVMTGQGDVATAVQAMKAGAIDFIEKPFADDLLLSTIETALATAAGRASRKRTIGDAAALIAMLSPRERQVLEGILAGRSSKMIAHDFGISTRTVEVHRARMLERLGTRGIAEAIRLAVMAGLGSTAG